MFKKKTMMNIADSLLIVGGLNWGLTLFDFNLVTWLGEMIKYLTVVEWVVYGAVFLSAIYKIVSWFNKK